MLPEYLDYGGTSDMTSPVEQLILANTEKKKAEYSILSNEVRVCSGCGNDIILDERPPSDKKKGRVRPCIVCERERKKKYRKNK